MFSIVKAEAPVFWPFMQTNHLLEKSLMLEKVEGRRRRGSQRIRWLDDVNNSMDMNLGKFREMVKGREAWCAAVLGTTNGQTLLGD